MNTKLTAGRPSARKEAMQALVKDESEGLVRINFELKKSEHRALKMLATSKDTTIANLLREEINKLIKSSD